MFIASKELKKMYSTQGSFYNLQIGRKEIKCRRYLDIFQKGLVIKNLLPEAFFVMMNPGNSRPILKKKDKQEEEIEKYNINDPNILKMIKKTSICSAAPDTTQYQVMRLMKIYDWRYVRILNLSDLRNTKSNEFIKEYKNLNNTFHSIFLGEREGGTNGTLYKYRTKTCNCRLGC
ncbi:hypothetical protein ACXEO8_20185 [Cytobacillus firmus]